MSCWLRQPRLTGWSWVRSRSQVVGGKGYELNKVELKGRPAPHIWKMDVSLPDEPFLEMTLWKTSFFLFWVNGHGHRLCQGIMTPTTSCVFFFQIFYPFFQKMEQPQTTKEGLNMASSYTKTFFFGKGLEEQFEHVFFVHSMNKLNHFSQPISNFW